jgi:putative transposase
VPAETRLLEAVLADRPGPREGQLWSLDLFRCESAVLHTYSVLVVMDHWTRRIVGFGVHRGVVDGVALCRMFNHATCG